MGRGEGGGGEEHHEHERLPQERESDAGQLTNVDVGDLEIDHQEAEECE